MGKTQAYDSVNRAFKSTCKVLLGEEIGEIREYEGYLMKYVEPVILKKSSLSGRGVAVSTDSFCRGASFISNDERDKYGEVLKGAKFSINDIKDVDSVLRALSENLCYTGNLIIGNSHEVENSDSISNSSFILNSSEIYDSKYIAHSDGMRYCEYIFGSNWLSESKFLIKNYETIRVLRSMECARIATSSDCYYSAGVEGCTNCLFTFNQRNKSHMIGNTELGRGEFQALKSKLICEIRETLKSKKEVPTMIDMIGGIRA